MIFSLGIDKRLRIFENKAMLATIISLIAASIVICLCIYIILEKRQPSSTLAWVYLIAVLPVLGIFVYLLFGRRRMHSRTKRKIQFRNEWQEELRYQLGEIRNHDLTDSVEKPYHSVIVLGNHGSNIPALPGNQLRLLRNADETYPELYEAIEGAKVSIHILFYIIHSDNVGNRLKEMLIRKAQEGVKIRLIYDDFGSIEVHRKWFNDMRRHGIDVRCFMPVLVPFALTNASWTFRNHRKIVIVDDKIGFTGGLNIGDEYEGRDPKIGPWRDTFVRIEGPAVLALNLVFMEDWHFLSDEILELKQPDIPKTQDGIVQIIGSGPDRKWDDILLQYFALINTAQESCYITTPYFVPSSCIRTALITAAMRGVDVRLLLPDRNDSRILQIAARSYYDELLEAGVRIYEYQLGFLHAKTICIDKLYSSIGSANMDTRSLHTNFEVNAFICDEVFSTSVYHMFLEDLRHSVEITSTMRSQNSLGNRFVEAVVHIASPLL